MISEKILPFPRGTTYSQCNSGGTSGLVTMADGTAKELEGRTYQVRDTIHKTSSWITLRIVKNHRTSNLLNLARKLVSFSAAETDDWGRRIDGLASTDSTDPCKPIDDAYFYGTEGTNQSSVMNSCTALDLFYVVDEGPCRVLHETTTLVAAGVAGTVGSTPGVAAVSAAGGSSFGTAMEAGDTAGVTATLYYVRAGVQADVP